MKKSLLSVGAASLAIAMFASGCASTKEPTFAERVQEVQNKIKKLDGLENHKTTDSKGKEYPQLPRLNLAQSKALYISWSTVARTSAVIRYGEADIVSVIRDATDTSNLKNWDAMRNADADKAAADAAVAEMKKFIAQSYAKNKTISKLSNDAVFDSVIGKVAQEDYNDYKKALKNGASEEDYKDQKTWLAKGLQTTKKAAAEQKKMLAEAEVRLAKAEKEAEAVNKEIDMTIKYTWKKAIDLPVAKAGVAIAKVTVEKGLPAAKQAVANAAAAVKAAEDKVKALPASAPAFVKNPVIKALEAAKAGEAEAIKQMDELKGLPAKAQKQVDKVEAELAKIKKEYPNVDKSIDMPNLSFDASNPESIKAAKDELTRVLEPWFYSLDMAAKRGVAIIEAKSFAREAQKSLDEVSGE